jgi:hypothetical protein
MVLTMVYSVLNNFREFTISEGFPVKERKDIPADILALIHDLKSAQR